MPPVLLALAMAAVAHTGDPVGVWKTPVDNGLVRLERCGADLCGHVAGSSRLLAFPDQKDARNKDQSLRGRVLMNLLIVKLHPLGSGRWGDGWVYNPDDGGTYKASLEMVDAGRLRLKGCLVAPLCRTQTWTRTEPAKTPS